MPNQITLPAGNTQTLHLTPMPEKFKAGDNVLCPALGNGVYTLAQHGDTINFKHKVYFIDEKGEQQIFRPNGSEYKGELPAIFHDTPANRQAITALYGIEYDTPTQSEPSPPILAVYGGMVWFYSIMEAHNPAIAISEPMTLSTAKAKLQDLQTRHPASQSRIIKNGMDIEIFTSMPYASLYLLQVMEASHVN